MSSVKAYLLSRQRGFALQRALRRNVWLAVVLFASCALVQAIFAVFPWIVLPVLWDVLMAVLAIASFAIFADSLFLRKPPLATIALLVETQSTLSHPWLSLSLELFHPKHGESLDLALAVHKQAESSISLIPPLRPRGSARRRFLALAISCTAFASGLLFLQPRCLTFWNLPLSFLVPIHARIWPGTIYVRSGASCTVGLVQSSGYFPSCRLVCSSIDESPEVSKLLAANQSGTFSESLGAIRQSTRYQFTLGNTPFPADTIFVVPKPRLQTLRIRLIPPRYTGIKPSYLPEGQGNFVAYLGTHAHFFVSAPSALSKAVLTSSDTRDTVALTVSGKNAQGDIVVKSHEVYTLALSDTFSQSSDSVPLFSIDVLPDAPPSVLIEKPGRNKDCSPGMRETLWVEGVDDIGLSRLTVATQRPGEQAVVRSERRFAASDSVVRLARLELSLNLGQYSLYPGDTLRYWATVCDNRAFGGPQCATSDTFFFRVPTFEEIHNQVAHEQDHTEQILQSARKTNSDLKQTITSLIQSTQGSSSLSWEQQQIVSDLKKSLSAQTDSLSAAVESFRDAVSKLSQQGSASEALLSKMSEVQKAIEELRRQYGDSLLFAPKKSGDQLSTRELRESLEKLKKTLPDLANRLETTLRFLRMLKRDQALASLAANAERLAHDQQTTASQPKSGESTSKQEEVCKGVNGLLSDIDKSSEGGDSALLSKSELPTLNKVSTAQKALRAGLAQRSAPSASDMNSMAVSLTSLSDELSSLQSSALARRAAHERDALLEIAHDALSMADMQESIASTSNSPDRSPGETAKLEQNLQAALGGSMNKLDRLSMISPDALVSMKRSYDNAAASINSQIALLSGSNQHGFARRPQADLGAIAGAALDALRQLSGQSGNQSGGMGGMMSGLKRLSSKQAMLNAATGELLRQMLGDGGEQPDQGTPQQDGHGTPGEGASGAKREAAAAQKAIADELKRLADSYGKESGASIDNKVKSLEDEARKLSAMFNNPSQELIDRQDRFLSRMLETSLSQHKQDEGKEERKSQSAQTTFASQQTDSTLIHGYSGLDAFYRLRQNAFAGGFPESYRGAVKSYFDSLGVLFLKEK